MKIFLDTSSLIKLYHYEDGTDLLEDFLNNYVIDEIYLSEISKIEFSSAIWKKVRTKEITLEDANFVVNCFIQDTDKFSFINIDSDLIIFAQSLLAKYADLGLRTLDSIQLASIINVRPLIEIASTADELLKRVMQIEGIKTL